MSVAEAVAKSRRPRDPWADEETCHARIEAHVAFDPIWREGHMSRTEAYRWITRAMWWRAPWRGTFHFGLASAAECRRAQRLCERKLTKLREQRGSI